MSIIVKYNYMTNKVPTSPISKMNWCSLVFHKRP